MENEQKKIFLSGFQKIIRNRLSQSYKNNIHVSMFMNINMSKVINKKKELEEFNPQVKYSLYSFFIDVVARCLKEFPIFNSYYINEEIFENKDINIGVALSFNERLYVPNIKKCQDLTINDIANSLNKKIEKVKVNKLKKQDISDGTFTITNLGSYGVDYFTSIINPPEVAILSIGSIKSKPICINNEIKIQPILVLGLTFCHNILNGTMAANFLGTIKSKLENYN